MNNPTSLLTYLRSSRDNTLALINSLSAEQLQVPYHPGINPPVWEMGHAAFFFERFLFQILDKAPSVNPALDDIWDSFELAHDDRWNPGLFPNKVETEAYFNFILNKVENRIQSKPLTAEDLYLYKYALFHLNMHVESLIWCRQTVGYPPPPSAQAPRSEPSSIPVALGDAEVPSGVYRIGMPAQSADHAGADFCFDNEKPGFLKSVRGFHISKTLVSNAEFLDFVEAGGYENQTLWGLGGQRWLRQHALQHPQYWKCENGQWMERHFDLWLPLQLDAPVKHVSYWEAQAYCKWAGRRLPTEAEWEVAALGNREGEPFKTLPWGREMQSNRVDMDGTHFARLPVTALSEGDSPFGCRQMIGTVWEWTSDQFMPYNGFSVDMYPFMSTLQFGDHKVVRGGSCATSSMLIRGTYRQAYLPERNDVYVGFRTCALGTLS
ncbi:SUMF1/EgtB/PvdO family nonheme iron enzyme [Limnobacter humi]|uniref:SUMF1/EgtB/PvdO family nonheme iron enzyme n=1 Tax=Limnobacter humi TaxID=1778671 RepID=A0ABT1WFY8_9BURK|nr:selenoneine synthase SenA [Limnobacter humi]MCQ8896433.1 SUMF1/EgtB/PvdO family nonheme iron enzyme [Limnobacter humi]